MKQKIKNLLSKKPIKILIRVIGVLCTLFTIFILLIIALGSCSSKSYDSNDNDNNIIEVVSNEPQHKDIDFYVDTYYIGFSELGNEIVYNSLLTTLIDDAHIESINFVSSNAWYNGRYFEFIANNIGLQPLTTSFTKHRFRYFDNSILFLMWENTDYYGIKIKKYSIPGGTGSIYNAYTYHFSWSNTTPDNVPTSFFADNMSVYLTGNFGLAYHHYIVDPGNPDNPNGVVNHSYSCFGALSNEINNNSYNIGYNEGFEKGSTFRSEVDYQDGYSAGYSAGYDDGIHQTSSTNLFSIIMQGFSAVSSVLNLQVMPGLTLGTLIFLPLAIMVVIAVFHLFKG